MNISGSGVSFSVGPRGASVTYGKRGSYLNTGIPGTGISARTLISNASSKSALSPDSNFEKSTLSAQVIIEDDGTLTFVDSTGAPLSAPLIEEAKKQNRDGISNLIQSTCDRINQQIETVAEVHLSTPNPDITPTFEPPSFDLPQPVRPQPLKPKLFERFIRSRREALERQNADALRLYETNLSEWRATKTDYENTIAIRKKLIEHDIYTDPAAMETHFESALREIEWPRETEVSFEIRDNGASIFLDVDLPEIEDMPAKMASVPQRGLKLTITYLSAIKVRKLYMDHVHGVLFRVIGEAFAALPTVKLVVASGYSQRPDKRTGTILDEYLLSVRVQREAWRQINFSNLAALDLFEALGRFELLRQATKAGEFRAIEPFAS